MVSNSYLQGLAILTFRVKNSYVWRLVFLPLGLVFLRLGVIISYVWGLDLFRFGGLEFLRLEVWNSYV